MSGHRVAVGKTGFYFNEPMAEKVRRVLAGLATKIVPHTVSVGIHAREGSELKIDYKGAQTPETVIEVALCHEFGIGVPQRAWLRSWFDSNLARLREEATAAMRAERDGDKGAVQAAAAKWAEEVRTWVQSGEAPLVDLADMTKAERRRAGLSDAPPLFATGQMMNAVTAKVDGQTVK